MPQSVVDISAQIMGLAISRGDHGQYLKALLLRNAYRERLESEAQEKDLIELESLLDDDRWSPLDKAVLSSLAAESYGAYLRRRYYLIRERTPLDDERGLPLDQMSAAGLLSRVLSLTKASLEPSSLLLDVSDKMLIPLVEQDKMSGYYNHDFYHLLSHRAIEVVDGLQSLGQERERMLSLRDSILDERVTQYERRGMRDALLLSLMDRWQRDRGGSSEDISYLDSLIGRFDGASALGQVFLEKASMLESMGSYAQALETAQEGLSRCAAHKPVKELKNLMERILRSDLQVSFESSQSPEGELKVHVCFRNLQGVSLSLYKTAYDVYPDPLPHQFPEPGKEKPVLETLVRLCLPGSMEGVQKEDLPYCYSDTTITMPLSLEPGVYLLRAVPMGGKDFSKKLLKAESGFVSVSNLAVLSMNTQEGLEVRVLERGSGHPVPNARVTFQKRGDEARKVLVADGEGRVLLPDARGSYTILAQSGKDLAMVPQNVYASKPYIPDTEERHEVTLLTDRSLYRPSQEVHFKGVAYNTSSVKAYVREGASFKVILRDASYQVLDTREVITGEMGSFSGSFHLPSSLMSGQLSISTEDGSGSSTFRVETYLRPAFEILFDDLTGIFRKGDDIAVTGKVLTYSGEPLSGGRLCYRITSSNRYDFRLRTENPQAADTLVLDSKGSFSIPVHLSSDVMNLEVTAWDVTNSTEQASLSVFSSDQPLRLSGEIPEMLDRDKDLETSRMFTLTNTQGTKVQAPVGYVLYRLGREDKFQDAFMKDPSGGIFREGLLRTNQNCAPDFLKDLPSGGYLLICRDEGGEELLKRRFLVYSSRDEQLEFFIPLFLRPIDQTFDTRHPARLLLGTSLEDAVIFLTLYSESRLEYTRVVHLDRKNQVFEIPCLDAYGQGITVSATLLRNGQVHTQSLSLKKSAERKRILASWEQFRDHTQPSAPLSWSLRLTDENGQALEAEMLSLLYDASLDAIYQRTQRLTWHPFVSLYSSHWMSPSRTSGYLSFNFPLKVKTVPVWGLDRFFDPQTSYYASRGPVLFRNSGPMMSKSVAYAAAGAAEESMVMADFDVAQEDEESSVMYEAPEPSPESGYGLDDMATVKLREDFSETGFFMPHLRTDAQGVIRMDFTAPERISRWRFNGFVHTRDMATLFLDTILVTQKDFSVEASLPRFACQGDEMFLPVALTNLTERPLKGTLEVTLFNLDTEKTIRRVTQSFQVPSQDRVGVQIPLLMPSDISSVGVMVRGRCDGYSDGERHALALLESSQRVEDAYGILLSETGRYKLDLDTIVEKAGLRSMTVEYTGNPSYLALQALCALAQSQGKDALSRASQLFSDFYLSGLFLHRPDVMEHFRAYARQDGALSEPLSTRASIKDILLEESPWVDASLRSKEAVAHALDLHGLLLENEDLLRLLEGLQGASGGWSWYEGMSPNPYITRQIALMLARLLEMTKDMEPLADEPLWMQSRTKVQQLLVRAMDYLDASFFDDWQKLTVSSKSPRTDYIGDDILDYLLLNQIQGRTPNKKLDKALSYYRDKLPLAVKDADLEKKALLSILLDGQGDKAHARECLESLKQYLKTERSLTRISSDEERMSSSRLLQRHLAVMEALDKDPDGMALLEGMRSWLLLEKKSNAWLTPQLTVRAVSRLLQTGDKLGLPQKDVLEISFKSTKSLRLGAGDLSMEYMAETLDQDQAKDVRGIILDKRNEGISWGTVYWSRTLPIEEVKDSKDGTGVRLQRQLLLRITGQDGSVRLQPLNEGEHLSARDQIVSRMVLHLDRDMDFIFVKDPLGAAMEPQEKTSRYRRLDGAGCYMELKDASVNFYFDTLGKGDYVIEHAFNVTKQGVFHVGAPTMECVYDPSERFHGHGELLRID